jgi:hypothetical protein
MRAMAFGSGWPGLVGRLGLLLLLPAVAGCGSGQGKVSGRVLYGGAPLPGGRVTFRPADPKQNSVSAELDAQGNYQVVLPAGEVKVCVDNRELEPAPPLGGTVLPPGLSPEVRKALGAGKPNRSRPNPPDDAPEKPSGRYVKIPDRYYEIETSGLQFTVEGGDQKRDIELTK